MNKYVLIIFIFIIWSCKNQIDSDERTNGEPTKEVVEEQTESEDSMEVEEPTYVVSPTDIESSTNLASTKWKLAGLVDSETGELKVLEPKDCDDCYTLKFDTDTTAQGKSWVNYVFLTSLNPIEIHCGTLALDCHNENQVCYCDLLKSVISYDVYESELILYLNNQNYLLFLKQL